jgi:hypothetical protein
MVQKRACLLCPPDRIQLIAGGYTYMQHAVRSVRSSIDFNAAPNERIEPVLAKGT